VLMQYLPSYALETSLLMDLSLLAVSLSSADHSKFEIDDGETVEPITPACDLRATDFMKVKRFNANRIIEEVEPKKA